jgi:hypothetical protein
VTHRADFGSLLCGSQRYEDHWPGDDITPKIVVRCRVSDQDVKAVVDTGAPWCIFPMDGPHPEGDEQRGRMTIRGETFDGSLFRGDLTLHVDEGSAVTIDATFFVPDLPEDTEWRYPNFIGLVGCLDRLPIAFATLNRDGWFHFGASNA